MKRFYQTASWAPSDDGYGLLLDGKPVRTPMGRGLQVPNIGLADALVVEWNAQPDIISPKAMPITQLVNTALDRVVLERAAVLDAVMAFAGHDLVCYRADHPEDLRRRQETAWQGPLDWAATQFGAKLRVTSGVVPILQPPASLKKLRDVVDRYGAWELTAFQALVPPLGSLILALTLTEGYLWLADVCDRAFVDDHFQIERWGKDDEAAERHAGLRRDIDAAARFWTLLKAAS